MTNDTTLPRVTVVVPAYNASSFIADCLQSIKDQDYENLELIVVDDGSTDDSAAIATSFEPDQLICQSNAGACAAHNAGLAAGTGSYVKFLDADDLMAPGAISAQVALLEGLKEREIGYGHGGRFGRGEPADEGRKIAQIFEPYLADVVARIIRTSWPLFPIEAVRDIGGYDGRLTAGQETNLHFRLALAGWRFIPQDVCTYFRRLHDEPARISNRQKSLTDITTNLENWLEPIADDDSGVMKDIRASRYVFFARWCLQRGQRAEAKALFALARQAAPHDHLRLQTKNYRLLYKVLGPMLAEKLIMTIQGVRE